MHSMSPVPEAGVESALSQSLWIAMAQLRVKSCCAAWLWGCLLYNFNTIVPSKALMAATCNVAGASTWSSQEVGSCGQVSTLHIDS